MYKPTLGIMGGGQLGSLISDAAKKLDIRTVIFSDDENAPGKYFSDEFIVGEYLDKNKTKEFCYKVDVITFEFENIPFETLNFIQSYKKVFPNPKINKIVQHRINEKDFINKCDLRTTKYAIIKNIDDIDSYLDYLPGILKTCTLGYDGKGQFKLNSKKELDNLNIDFSKNFILEKLVNLKKEISVIITRFGHQNFLIYEPIENVHEDQILRVSKIPAKIEDKIIIKSKEWASILAEELDYIGTMCVEFFIDVNDNLYVNEIAPRVHNSGHLTIDAYNISQFENHVRAVCGLEKLQIKKLHNAKMINLIGKDIELYKSKSFSELEFFYDYKKKEIKEKRKMGHLTILQPETRFSE